MEFVKLAYSKRGESMRILYRLLPVLIQRYIQINYIKYEGTLNNEYNRTIIMFHIDIQLRIQSIQPGPTITKLVMQRCGNSYTVLGSLG